MSQNRIPTVAQQDRTRKLEQTRQDLDRVGEELRRVKQDAELEADQDLVDEELMEPSPNDYQPWEWQNPQAWPQAPAMDPPWQVWNQNYSQAEVPTILDWLIRIEEIRDWWDPESKFHQLVASKLIVMDWLEDPQAVMIEHQQLRQLTPAQQWEQILRLQRVIEEVQQFQGTPPQQTRSLVASLEAFGARTGRTTLIQDIQQLNTLED